MHLHYLCFFDYHVDVDVEVDNIECHEFLNVYRV